MQKLKNRQTYEGCGVCEGTGVYDHECDEDGRNMTLMAELDYVHWSCYNEAVRLQDEYDKRSK